MTFLHALGGVFSLLFVVALGYFLAMRGWFPDPCRKMFPRLITVVSLPPFLACTIISSVRRDDLIHMVYGAAVPFILMCLLFALAWATALIIRVPKKRFGLFCACVSNPNTIFIGIPVNLALFGPESTPYVLLYYFASTIFFWTVGNYFISRDAGEGARTKKIRWQSIISPPMIGFLCGIFIICLNIPIPQFLFRSASLVGELTTPLALFFIGMTLESIGLGNLRPDRTMIFALLGRLCVSPLLMLLLLPLFGLPELMGKVFVIQSSLPVIFQIAILSAYYNTDPEFGSEMIALSTLSCAVTIPVYMIFL